MEMPDNKTPIKKALDTLPVGAELSYSVLDGEIKAKKRRYV
jgi:hypothetical protein